MNGCPVYIELYDGDVLCAYGWGASKDGIVSAVLPVVADGVADRQTMAVPDVCLPKAAWLLPVPIQVWAGQTATVSGTIRCTWRVELEVEV